MEDYEIDYLPEEKPSVQPQRKQKEQPQEEGFLESIPKTAGRLALRAGETALGLPGDIASLGFGIPHYLSGGETPSYGQVQEKIGHKLLPTSEQLKQGNIEEHPWAESPKNSWSESLERPVETLTSLALPGGFTKGAKLAAASVLGSEAVGWLSKQLGASEPAQEALRIGTLLTTQLAGGRAKVKELASSNYNKARELAEGAERVDAHGISNTVNSIGRKLKEGKTTEAKEWAAKEIATLQNKLNNGGISTGSELSTVGNKAKRTTFGVNDAVQYVQDLKADLREGNVPFRAKHYANEIIDSLKNNVIDPYSKVNPEFGKSFNSANEAWSALYKEGKISNFMHEHLSGKPFASKLVNGLLHAGAYGAAHNIGGLASSAPIAGAGIAGMQAYRMIDLMKKSSIARSVYGDLMRASLAGNVATAAKSATKLDKIAHRYEESNPEPKEEDAWEIVSL